MTARAILIWAALVAAILTPLSLAAASPLLAYRDAIYIAAGFAGVLSLALLLVQPLLAGGLLPGVPLPKSRRVHRWVGGLLVIAILLHVLGLWITSPPDVIDALLLRSPTPFSVWGVLAMWAVLATGLLALFRRKLGLRIWRVIHMGLAVTIVVGTVAHALLIEGIMEWLSKLALCALVVAAAAKPLISTWRLVRKG